MAASKIGIRSITVSTAILVLLLACVVHGRDRQFEFDANGNLHAQTGDGLNPPQILGQPQPQVVEPGALASFSVLAADTRALTYQWRFNGTDLGGATADALLLTNVSAAHEGLYSVSLVNSSGSITSAPAALLLDGDGDGLPDSWEQTCFGGLGQRPSGDFDGDGVSNLDEWLDGTNPADSASLLFRLTVISDGGNVAVNPGRFTFTNGESVTLTAAAISPNTFHGWRGATNTTENPISLTMNGNKTVYAYLGSYQITWTNNASGDWNDASNWSPDFVPGNNDDVIISKSLTVTLNSDAECGGLTLSTTPTLTGSGMLVLHRNSAWFSGTMNGSGRTVVAPGAMLDFNGASTKTISGGRILENGGTMSWNAGNIQAATATVITNRAGALFLVPSAAGMTPGAGGGRFDNAGTFRKTAAGTTTINGLVSFNNYGTVELLSGTLSLAGGGLNDGTMDLAAGTTLGLAAGTFNSSGGSSITGAGQFMVSGATANLAGLVAVTGTNRFDVGTANLTGNYICTNNTLVVSGGTANFSGTGMVTPAVVSMDSGTLSGSQNVTVLQQMNWSGGTMSGPGRTVIPPSVTLTINAGTVTLSGGRILENGGTTLWNAGNIQAATATVITNRAGALFQVQSAAGITPGAGGGRFDNAGTFLKTSAGTTTVNNLVSFNNYGAVELQSGTLSLMSGGLNEGTMDVAAGTTLGLTGGTFTSSAASSITGAGNFLVSNGATPTVAGLVNVSGTNTFSVSTANLTGNYICTNNTLVVSGGTVNFNGTGLLSPAFLTLGGGGTMNGSQDVTVGSVMNWTGGTLAGSGRTIIQPSAILNVSGGPALSAHTLENGGTAIWTGGLNIGSAVITNRAGALFELRSAASLNSSSLPGSRFDNAGTFRKSVNTGTATVFPGMAFNNYNAVEIQTGTLSLSGGGTHTGTFDVQAGSALNLSGGTHTANVGSSITGAGQFTVGGAIANLAGLVNVSGTNKFSGGTATMTGNYISTNNTIVVSGTANFNGTGLVSPAFLTLSSGTMNSSQDVTVGSVMNWTGGTLGGSGRTIIHPFATLNGPGSVALSAHTLENGGTVIWTGSLNIGSAVITNRAGALFDLRSATILNSSSLPGSRFDNAGTFRKSVNTGTATIFTGMAFNNYNTVEIQTGILTANGGYVSTANSLLKCALSGTTVGTGYGRLQVGGTVTLNGGLSVDLLPGFTPATNDTFTVLTAGTRNGTFADFSYPSNRVTMTLSNAPTSVILRTTDVFSIPQPVLLTPELAGPDVKLTWTATSNIAYRLEFNSKVDSSNWTAIAGDVTTLSNTASKLDVLTPSNRLYRVRVLQ